MSNKKAVDRRVRRTRALLQNALIQLLEEKPLAKIQIKEITERADVSRQTFYLHFETKEELLFSYMDDVFDQLHVAVFQDASKINHLDTQTLLTESFRAYATHVDALRWVMQVENKDLLIERLRIHIDAIMNAYASLPDVNIQRHHLHEHSVDFVTGGIYMLLRRWLSDDLKPSAAEMGVFTNNILTNLVKPSAE